jgi:hypothetical protein
MGYEEQATAKDNPVGYTNVFFAKRLTPNVT